jgi:glycosyltransferase involved in cell wall biosynthesis
MALTYAVITPARDEAVNLPRLAGCLAAQSVRPAIWKIVENGSSDETLEVAEQLAREHDWIDVLMLPGTQNADRGAPVVRALQTGITALAEPVGVVINVDADMSMDEWYFERLVAKFEADPELGIASGGLLELDRGRWRPRHLTGNTVVGASRAYRWECLQEVLPLEERVGWDGLDEFKANARGWTTRLFDDIVVRHHRREGERDGASWRARWNQGHAAWFMGYRLWYLVLRAVWHARRDPGALALIAGYTAAVLQREPRNPDLQARAYLRRQQSWRNLRTRALEASGRRRKAA